MAYYDYRAEADVQSGRRKPQRVAHESHARPQAHERAVSHALGQLGGHHPSPGPSAGRATVQRPHRPDQPRAQNRHPDHHSNRQATARPNPPTSNVLPLRQQASGGGHIPMPTLAGALRLAAMVGMGGSYPPLTPGVSVLPPAGAAGPSPYTLSAQPGWLTGAGLQALYRAFPHPTSM